MNNDIDDDELINSKPEDDKINEKKENISNDIIDNELNNNNDNEVKETGRKSDVIEEKLSKSNDQIIFQNKNNSEKVEEAKEIENNQNQIFYEKVPFHLLKRITFLTVIINVILGILGILFFLINRKSSPCLFCFQFINRKNGNQFFLFLSDLNSFVIIHFVLFLIIILWIIIYFKYEQDANSFFQNINILFCSALVANCLIFIFGIFASAFQMENWQPILDFILSGFGSFCFIKLYLKLKNKPSKNLFRLITQNTLISIFTPFEIYCCMFNFCRIITLNNEQPNAIYEIIPSLIYFILGFAPIIFFKDIVFTITVLIVEIGLLYAEKNTKIGVIIVHLFETALTFFSIIVIVFKFNKNIFNTEKNSV